MHDDSNDPFSGKPKATVLAAWREAVAFGLPLNGQCPDFPSL